MCLPKIGQDKNKVNGVGVLLYVGQECSIPLLTIRLFFQRNRYTGIIVAEGPGKRTGTGDMLLRLDSLHFNVGVVIIVQG